MRIDDFSRNELRESHATRQELISQISELQERMNCMENFKMQSRFAVENYLPSKSSIHVEPRPKHAI